MMDKWLILHAGSKFSKVLGSVLGDAAIMLDVSTLINDTQLNVNVSNRSHHRWLVKGVWVDDFDRRVVYQEVFYRLETVLGGFDVEDREYVQYSWQAYLLCLFSHTKLVMNPVNPRDLTASHYQFPRLLNMAKDAGVPVPRYELGREGKNGYMAVDSLWFYPGSSRDVRSGMMNIELCGDEWCVVRFVRYDKTYLVCWPEVPNYVKAGLLKISNEFGLRVGEAHFRVGKEWHFYGLRPQLETEGSTNAELRDIAQCLRDIGNGERG